MTVEAVLVVIGAIVTIVGVAALAARLPPRRRAPAPPARAVRGSRPSQLLRIERIVERSRESDLAAHTQLRPLLTEIADARLARHGLRLDRDSAEARRLLGAAVWALVRPDRPAPPDGRAPGVALGDLEAALSRLEAL